MKIAVSSGKGGVGKTLATACLASVMAESQPVCYVDCDVEAPNGHLFLKTANVESADEALPCIEGMDPQRCTYCGQCARVCYFNALAVGRKNAIAFPELCRWCGACLRVCPADALIVGRRVVGTTYRGRAGLIRLHWATLAAGAGGMTVRLIEQLKERTKDEDLIILDSPPGTSCSAVHTIRGADIIILVADPTRFGVHDLKLSVRLCRSMHIEPMVLMNRVGLGDADGLRRWCREHHLRILAELPDSREIARLYSQGILPVTRMESLRQQFLAMAQALRQLPPVQTAADNPEVVVSWQQDDLKQTESPGIIGSQSATQPVEITIVSGKGGTGKTSLCACFAQMAGGVVADCDVDAADMHLLLEPKVLEQGVFRGGRVMQINPARCTRCRACVDVCQWKAIRRQNDGSVTIAEQDCEGCGTCLLVCPVDAIGTEPTDDGRWYWSSTRLGPMSHAMLEPGRENSGKLVTLVRKQAAVRADGLANANRVVVLDGSPGTGCPVIASVGGARAAVIVTEPTVSGLHDLERILELTEHFRIRTGIIINKADLNRDMAEKIKFAVKSHHADLLGELPYDTVFVQAQQAGKTVLEYQPDSELSETIRLIWKHVQSLAGIIHE
ncbi:MAG TPA: ATP-binding protein [Anaerohalosphaeraceae bacterium]|nr:ATP-binding protein [Anaerohalosphaeraceae bacterium]